MDTGMDSNATADENFTTVPDNCSITVHPYFDIINQVYYASILPATIGIPGNILAFAVWIRPRMRNSSGVYMAVLAITQTLMLACRMLLNAGIGWNPVVLDNRIMCLLFPVIYYAVQYLDTLLYIAFTVERYISVCHPFQRVKLCTIRRSIVVSVCLVCLSFIVASMQAYIWKYDDVYGCDIRIELISGYFWNVWSIITDALFFLLVSFAVLALNILVIRAIKRSRNRFDPAGVQKSNNNEKDTKSTRPLLYVSFYFILLTLPSSVVHVIVNLFPEGSYECIVQEDDIIWSRLYTYYLVRTFVELFALLHYALNFYIYICVGETFRNEVRVMIHGMVRVCKYRPDSNERMVRDVR